MTLDPLPWGAVLTLMTLLSGVGLIAMDERNRRKFVAKDDGSLDRVHHRIDVEADRVQGLISLHASLDDRLGDTERLLARMDERQTQHWERISKELHTTAVTIRDVMVKVESVSSQQMELAGRMERMRNGAS